MTVNSEYLATPSVASSSQRTVNKFRSSTSADLLISKLPEFNPHWSEDCQSRWLSAFEQLIKLEVEKSRND